MDQSPELEDVIDGAAVRRLASVFTMQPGVVTSYDHATQLAEVQPGIMDVYLDARGERRSEPLTPIPAVPVAHHGGGGFRTTYPIAKGDTVMMCFSSTPLDRWLARGGVVDPEAPDKFRPGDAVAITGLRDFKHPLALAPSDMATFGHDGGRVVAVTESEVRLGTTTASEGVAVESTLAAILTALGAAITDMGADPAATALAALLSALGDLNFPVCSQRVKAVL